MTTITSSVFLAAGVTCLVLMLRHDLAKMEDLGFDSHQFYQWITDDEEYLTVKRIIALVVLVGSVTTMALSHYVVAILAATLLALDTRLWLKRPPLRLSARGKALLAATGGLTLALVALAGTLATLRHAGIAAVMAATFSYALTWCVNLILPSHIKKKETKN